MEYNKEEEQTFRLDLFRRMDKQDIILSDIKIQTTKTNGRVTVLEVKTEDYTELKKTISSLEGWKMYVGGIVAVMLLCGGFVGFIVYKNILYVAAENTKDQIDNSTEDQIKKATDAAAQKVLSELELKYNITIEK